MADEMTLRADVRDKGRANAAEEGSCRVRGERIQFEAQVRNCGPAEIEAGDTSGDTDAQQPRECDRSSPPQFSLKTYLRRSFSTASSSIESLSSSPQSNMGVDCAGIILNCLFCRFYSSNCCPNYKQVVTAAESASSSDDDSCTNLDCGLLSACNEGGDCLELAMEVSELCFH
ncbi:myoD family inhibitor domain-containing protein 2 [Hippoglossus hippoglossus]|uniref:myoD family inhibitor domain-containing protein 2 n=1 Tax=Hippoglossus hippoglossus TaxID=8267 RepID=UPI00148CDDDB|nr:myoD family inhibitor domain-containing protein 2 [Hippoglossus hippoglossus]